MNPEDQNYESAMQYFNDMVDRMCGKKPSLDSAKEYDKMFLATCGIKWEKK